VTDYTVAPWVAIVVVKLMLAAVVERQGREIVVEVPPVLSLNMNRSSLLGRVYRTSGLSL
jgi:hypothetical protein